MALGLSTCGDSTGPPLVALIQLLDGCLSAEVATSLSFSVRIYEASGIPIEGTPIVFSPSLGSGTVLPTTLTTGATGQVMVTWTLGETAGTQSVRVSAGEKSIVVEASATPGAPEAVVAFSGDTQTGVVGAQLDAPVVAQVQDRFGNGVPGVLVIFEPANGSVSATQVTSDEAGNAQTGWTLGERVGPQALEASVPGVAVPTTVSATALAGPPTLMVLNTGDGQNPVIQTAVSVAPSVLITDAFGNPVEGVAVTFAVVAGGGSATGADQVTNAAGIATVGSWTVGSAVGLNTLSATAGGLGSVTFNATAVLAPVFDLEVRFTGTPPTASQRTAFEVAASRWEQLVTGDLIDVPLVVAAGACGGLDHPDIDETVDDLLIFAEFVTIDGPGGTLASAGPCFTRSANGLSVAGSMRFDVADVDGLEASGNLGDVILHEMARVLGLGTLSSWYDILRGSGGPDPFFPGTAAVSHYTAAGGTAPSPVPVANTGGERTRDVHWREAHMGRELMTGFLALGVSNPLSAITVGALQDLGYVVDASAADAYEVLPGLRLEEDELIPLEEIAPPPPLVIDEHGRVTPIRR